MYTAQPPADPTAVIGRRIGAFLINLVLFFGVLIFSARTLADFKREDLGELPPAVQRQIDAQNVDVCDLIEADNDISLCFRADDTVFYATGSDAAGKLFGPPLIASFINSVLLAGIAGGSIGKLIFGLRVIRRDTGQRAGFGAHLVRWFLWIVDGFFYCFPLVGLITGLATKGHRRVGDMAAGTLVVRASSVGSPPLLAGAPAAGAAGGWPPPSQPVGYGAPPNTPGTWAPPPAPSESWAPPAPRDDPWAATPAAPPAPRDDPWAATPAPPPAPHEDPWATALSATPAPVTDPWAMPSSAAAPVSSDPRDTPAPAPEPEPTPAPQPAATADAAAATSGPQWDPARNAYIQWEPVSGQWMQFDDAAQTWRPLT